jgi:hypothetical protein
MANSPQPVRGQYVLKQGTNQAQITKTREILAGPAKLFATVICLELGYEV